MGEQSFRSLKRDASVGVISILGIFVEDDAVVVSLQASGWSNERTEREEENGFKKEDSDEGRPAAALTVSAFRFK